LKNLRLELKSASGVILSEAMNLGILMSL
jgi:hypothetical protein